MKYLIIIMCAVLCSCGTSKKVSTERITTSIQYIDSVQRVALPQLTNTIKLPNVSLDTVIITDNVKVKVSITDKDIAIITQLTDSVDIVTINKIITTSNTKETKTVKRRSNVTTYLLLLLLILLLFRIRGD